MARRKNQFMDDNDSSGESEDSADGETFDPNDPDGSAERELFRNPYQTRGHKRSREEAVEDATYGVFADYGGEYAPRGGRGRGRGGSRRVDYTKTPDFVSAGASSSKAPQALDNLSGDLGIETNKEDDGMELDSDSSDGSEDENVEEEDGDGISQDGETDDNDTKPLKEEEEGEMAPIPGLARPPPPTPPSESFPTFVPRGIGSKGRSKIGNGGIGSKVQGLNNASSSTFGSTTMPNFASATSASDRPLGGLGLSKVNQGADSPMAGASTPKTGLGGSRAQAGDGDHEMSRNGEGHTEPNLPRKSLAERLAERLAAEDPSFSSRHQFPPTDTTSATPPPEAVELTRERRSFLPSSAVPKEPMAVPSKISKKEQQHFAQLSSSGNVGMKLLEKMGWKSGTGLGANQQGIVTPIGEGQKVRAKGAGLATGERSHGSIIEERRRKGEDPDGEEKKEKKNRKSDPSKHRAIEPEISKDAWQSKRKGPKPRMEYKTYEQIVAEQGGEPEGIGMLVDLSGNALPSQSISSLPNYGAASVDTTRLPELRHNLALLTSTAASSLSALAREGKGIEERRTYLDHEETRVRKIVDNQNMRLIRLKSIIEILGKVRETEKMVTDLMSASSDEEILAQAVLSPFSDDFDDLFGHFPDEYREMHLDEIVVAAISPSLRRLWQTWDPLSSPRLAVSELKRWKKHFLMEPSTQDSLDSMDVDVFGSARHTNGGSSKSTGERAMTAYETMMWTIWLPRVRSALNNTWSPSNPGPAVELYTAWVPILPSFIQDNVLDQLILPKVSKAIQDWSPSSMEKSVVGLHTIVFPWLEHAGHRTEQILDESKRRVRAWLKMWKSSDGVPKGLEVWRDAMPVPDWDTLMLKHILPQLGSTLRDRFEVNPRQQDLQPLEKVVAWAPLLRSSMLSELLEGAFFPKWLDALYIWLTNEANLEQVAEWYTWWKSYFSEEIGALSGVTRGFRKGLDLMNQAMALGSDAKYRLKPPDTRSKSVQRQASSSSTPSSAKSGLNKQRMSSNTASILKAEVTFRSLVEEMAAAANLIFLGTGQSDEKGHALFRVSSSIDGKRGCTVYLDDDVVWVQDSGRFIPISVEEMVKRASG